MTGTFDGWPERAYEVLLELDGEPSPAVRKRWRREREQLVRRPMIALLHDVAAADEAYEDFSVWGLGTMVWPWQRQQAMVRVAARFEFGLRFDLDGLWVQGGWGYRHLDRYRAAVAADGTGSRLAGIVDDLAGKGFEISGDTMKRSPRGYPAGHPRDELLRRRALVAGRPMERDEWVHTPEAVGWVLETFTTLGPLMSWFAEQVADGCRDCGGTEPGRPGNESGRPP